MKFRGNRTHFSGTSNRPKEQSTNAISMNKTSQILEKSYNKSQSLYYKSTPFERSIQNSEIRRTSDPFQGTHTELETARFNPLQMKPYKQTKMIIPRPAHTLNLKDNVNQSVKDILVQFQGKDVNMHKLGQLKRAFLTNCVEKRYLKQYFNKFSNEGEVVDRTNMKKLVKEFGFDVNDDEVDLLFRMTNRNAYQGLNINSFIDLMTKENVYFDTVNFDRQHYQCQSFFSPKIHEVLRNKFFQLKEAFKIYSSRGEDVREEEFNYVMKKLDLTDLVITKKQKMDIFNRFKNQNGSFNQEGLICLIAEQENARIKTNKHQSYDFQSDLKLNIENQHEKDQKLRKFNLKLASNLQYQKHLSNATRMLRELRYINRKKDIMAEIMPDEQTNQDEFKRRIEILFQKEGLNFQKKQYEAFIGYLDFNKDKKINRELATKFIIHENQMDGQERLQRKVRAPPPRFNKFQQDPSYDFKTAQQAIKKINDHKLNPELKGLFEKFDQDKDGYISNEQFSQKIYQMNILENWQIKNLISFMDQENKGFMTFKSFADRMNQKDQLPIVAPNKLKSHSCAEWSTTKKKFINTNNKYIYQCPTKYSAWPERLKDSDLSLIQAAQKSGMYQSETDRFNIAQKYEFGLNQKQRCQRIHQNKLKKLTEVQNKADENVKKVQKKQEDKNISRNYFLRLSKQIYQQHCHP